MKVRCLASPDRSCSKCGNSGDPRWRTFVDLPIAAATDKDLAFYRPGVRIRRPRRSGDRPEAKWWLQVS